MENVTCFALFDHSVNLLKAKRYHQVKAWKVYASNSWASFIFCLLDDANSMARWVEYTYISLGLKNII